MGGAGPAALDSGAATCASLGGGGAAGSGGGLGAFGAFEPKKDPNQEEAFCTAFAGGAGGGGGDWSVPSGGVGGAFGGSFGGAPTTSNAAVGAGVWLFGTVDALGPGGGGAAGGGSGGSSGAKGGAGEREALPVLTCRRVCQTSQKDCIASHFM